MTDVALTKRRAKELRRDMTDAERVLWFRLRAGRLGVHFRRQAPIGPYIADFVAFERRLVVEVDGGQHAEPGQAVHDRQRTAFLVGEGFRVLRFWNNAVLGNLEGVLETISAALNNAPLVRRPLSPGPSPTRGEGSGKEAAVGRGARRGRNR